jgi:hypothetical protein
MPVSLLPIIAYDNLLTHADSTTTGTGTDPENAYDWRQDDVWTTLAASGELEADLGATTETANYYAISTHDLFTNGATVKLRYWTGGAYADVPGSSFTPVADVAFVVPFEPVESTKFKLVVTTGGTAAQIAVASFGEYLEMEQGLQNGYSPPRFARRDTVLNNRSQGGKFIGRSLIRTGTSGTLSFKTLDEQWLRNNVDPFILASRTQGWFFLWNPLGRPEEAAYCWTSSTPNPAQTGGGGFTAVSIAYEGVTV